MKIQISKEQVMTRELLAKILELHAADEARKQRLANYYLGKHAILNRTMTDASKPNNKSVNAYGNYITDTVVGYFMGQPVTYSATDDSYQEFADKIKEIFAYNDEQSENVELAKNASKVGGAYELMYLDEDANIRFKKLDPIYSIPVFSNTLDEELIYFIRYYNDNILDPFSRTIEVYDAGELSIYKQHNKEVEFSYAVPHPFGMVPIAIYWNNEEELGDYEIVVNLIDSYDKLSSDNINDFEQFADAYLILKGMDATNSDDISAMKQNRVLLLPQEGDAQWLVKNINDVYFQNTLKNLDENIHKFSKVPDMMNESFGANLSGIAIKYKLMGLENKVAIKEAHFKKGLQRRLELISRIMYVMGSDFDYLGIDIQFHRNLPVNELEAVSMANALNGLVSDETMLGVLPFVNDAKAELEKRDAQLDLNSVPIDIINEPQSQE